MLGPRHGRHKVGAPTGGRFGSCVRCVAEEAIEATAVDIINSDLPTPGIVNQQVVAEEAEVCQRKYRTLGEKPLPPEGRVRSHLSSILGEGTGSLCSRRGLR